MQFQFYLQMVRVSKISVNRQGPLETVYSEDLQSSRNFVLKCQYTNFLYIQIHI